MPITSHFHHEDAAFAFVEAHVWPNGPVCPHCGNVDRIGKLAGKSTRIGLWKCYYCRKPFTVKIGTIFEGSHVPLHLWLQAMFLIAGSTSRISSEQLGRILGVTIKTAWQMSTRIRVAIRDLDEITSENDDQSANTQDIAHNPQHKNRG
jgi:transposase-like protein